MTVCNRLIVGVLLALVIVVMAVPSAAAQDAPRATVSVTGEVQRPGPIDWTPELTVQQAIDRAGGLTDRARQPFYVARDSGSLRTKFMATLSAPLRAGDTLEVLRRPFAGTGPRLRVLGEVTTPGEYTLTSDADTFALAIVAAGGLTPRAGTDLQIWRWMFGKGTGPISDTTSRADIVITHVSRRSLDEKRVPQYLFAEDDETIFVPARETASSRVGHVTVTGDVRAPGEFALGAGTARGVTTLKDALAKSGGRTPTAGNLVMLSRAPRDGLSKSLEMVTYQDVTAGDLDLPLRDGDVIDVPQSRLVTVSGAGWSSSLSWTAGLTLQAALDRLNRSSPIENAQPRVFLTADRVKVRRQTDGGAILLDGSPDLVLLPKDEIVIIH